MNNPYRFVPHQITLWLLDLSITASDEQQLLQCLNSDERQYANLFHSEQDGNRFRICRGMVKHILGRYLALPPNEVHLSYTPHGKPFQEHTTLQFNLSHTQNIAVLAVTAESTIGVDVEHIRDFPELEAVAWEFLSDEAFATVVTLPTEQRLEAFYNVWTGKEAYAKAIGYGLRYSIRQVHIPIIPARTPLILPVADKLSDALSTWQVFTFRPLTGYAASVATDANISRITIRSFEFAR